MANSQRAFLLEDRPGSLAETYSSSSGPVDATRLADDVLMRHRSRSSAAEDQPSKPERRRSDAPDSYARSALEAGREAASKVTEDEYRGMVERHRALALGKIREEISARERMELQLLRWELDRIEDARHGTALDLLRAMAMPRQDLARDIDSLVSELRSLGVGERSRSGRRR